MDKHQKRIVLLADLNSPHTIKWANIILKKGFEVYVIGMDSLKERNLSNYTGIHTYNIGFGDFVKKNNALKLAYFASIFKLKKILRDINPDILHAHYASSYGLIGALSNARPFMVSVWGSDVFEFPKRSFFSKKLLQFVFTKADIVFSTSHIMASEIGKYTDKRVDVIPFGINIDQFIKHKCDSIFNENDIVIGTVKSLEKIYGIEYLVEAFKIVHERHRNLPLKLLIVGGGTQEEYYRNLVEKLGLADMCVFTGAVPVNQVSKYHNMLSIYVAVSIEESFGVAVIEASACEVPVVVSNVGGLPEVVDNDVTGYIVPSKSVNETASAIEKLVLSPILRVKMGQAGRRKIVSEYNIDDNVDLLMECYSRYGN